MLVSKVSLNDLSGSVFDDEFAKSRPPGLGWR